MFLLKNLLEILLQKCGLKSNKSSKRKENKMLTTFDEIIEMNVDKLKKRYPGGEFNVHQSENRKAGDL